MVDDVVLRAIASIYADAGRFSTAFVLVAENANICVAAPMPPRHIARQRFSRHASLASILLMSYLLDRHAYITRSDY